jgi:hypothetical protein
MLRHKIHLNYKIIFIYKININNLDLLDFNWINLKYIHKKIQFNIIIFHLNLQYQKQVNKFYLSLKLKENIKLIHH